MPFLRSRLRHFSAVDRLAACVPKGPYRDWVLLLDLDGTLIDLKRRPLQAEMPLGLPGLLYELWSALDGALAIFTGRSLADADRLLDLPHLPIAAEYGAVIRARGKILAHRHGGESLVADVLRRLEPELARDGRIEVERKAYGFVLHFDRDPDLDDPIHRLAVEAVAPHHDMLRLIHARHVLEIRCAGSNAGNAVERLWPLMGWQRRTPVFLGDDLPDLAGFAAARRLGGHAVSIGERLEPGDYRLPDPEAARAWLARIADALRPHHLPDARRMGNMSADDQGTCSASASVGLPSG